MANLRTELGDKLRAAKAKVSQYAYGASATYWSGYADALSELTNAHYYAVLAPYADKAIWTWLTEGEAQAHLEAGYSLRR